MAKIEKFEDIRSWKKARELSKIVYATTNRGAFCKDFGLKDQMRRAAVSILSNIAEGFEREGNREFVQFLHIAKGSVAEVQAQLYVALDAEYISKTQFDEIYNLASEVSRLIGGFVRYLSQSDLKGRKFK